jgi:hypothetical protein
MNPTTITQGVAQVGTLVLTVVGGLVWLTPSIELASVYWLMAAALGLVIGVLGVLAGRSGAEFSMIAFIVLVGLAPFLVSLTPAWQLYPVAAGTTVWAAREVAVQADPRRRSAS